MSMLAEEKTKKRKLMSMSVMETKTTWNSENNFGSNLMEKFGWSKGLGLGKNKQGSSTPIRPRAQLGSLGLGAKEESLVPQHFDKLEGALAEINNKYGINTGNSSKVENFAHTSSLACKKKIKKNVNQLSDKDLKCITGISSSEQKKSELLQVVTEEEITNNCLFSTNNVTIQEYFSDKLKALREKRQEGILADKSFNVKEIEQFPDMDFEVERDNFSFNISNINTPQMKVNKFELESTKILSSKKKKRKNKQYCEEEKLNVSELKPTDDCIKFQEEARPGKKSKKRNISDINDDGFTNDKYNDFDKEESDKEKSRSKLKKNKKSLKSELSELFEGKDNKKKSKNNKLNETDKDMYTGDNSSQNCNKIIENNSSQNCNKIIGNNTMASSDSNAHNISREHNNSHLSETNENNYSKISKKRKKNKGMCENNETFHSILLDESSSFLNEKSKQSHDTDVNISRKKLTKRKKQENNNSIIEDQSAENTIRKSKKGKKEKETVSQYNKNSYSFLSNLMELDESNNSKLITKTGKVNETIMEKNSKKRLVENDESLVINDNINKMSKNMSKEKNSPQVIQTEADIKICKEDVDNIICQKIREIRNNTKQKNILKSKTVADLSSVGKQRTSELSKLHLKMRKSRKSASQISSTENENINLKLASDKHPIKTIKTNLSESYLIATDNLPAKKWKKKSKKWLQSSVNVNVADNIEKFQDNLLIDSYNESTGMRDIIPVKKLVTLRAKKSFRNIRSDLEAFFKITKNVNTKKTDVRSDIVENQDKFKQISQDISHISPTKKEILENSTKTESLFNGSNIESITGYKI